MDWRNALLLLIALGLVGRAVVYSFVAKPRSHGSWVLVAALVGALVGAVVGSTWLILVGVLIFAAGEFYVQVIARGWPARLPLAHGPLRA